MKTAEEILNEVLVDVEDRRPVFFKEQDVVDLIGQAQKEAYNQALDDALNSAVVETIIDERGIHRIIHKDSILRLKL